MNFSHIRGSDGQLLATIASKVVWEETMAYGVALVSETEHPHTITVKKGRSIASGRCESAERLNMERYEWKEYDGDPASKTMQADGFQVWLQHHLGKFGLGSRNDWRDLIKLIREEAVNRQ